MLMFPECVDAKLLALVVFCRIGECPALWRSIIDLSVSLLYTQGSLLWYNPAGR